MATCARSRMHREDRAVIRNNFLLELMIILHGHARVSNQSPIQIHTHGTQGHSRSQRWFSRGSRMHTTRAANTSSGHSRQPFNLATWSVGQLQKNISALLWHDLDFSAFILDSEAATAPHQVIARYSHPDKRLFTVLLDPS